MSPSVDSSWSTPPCSFVRVAPSSRSWAGSQAGTRLGFASAHNMTIGALDGRSTGVRAKATEESIAEETITEEAPRFTALPEGTSHLTATPWDDFDASEKWVELAALDVATCAGAFWHCIDAWTYDLHFNKNIWRIDVCSEAHLALDGSELRLPQAPCEPAKRGKPSSVPKRPRKNAPPPEGQRWIALRELKRKTPAPVGGGPDGRGLSYSAHEWTAQYFSLATGRHTAVFALVVPEAALVDDNPRALTMWPFQYPKTRAVAVSYEASASGGGGKLRYSVLPLEVGVSAEGRDYEKMKTWASKSAMNFLNLARKRCNRWDPETGLSTYTKRVVHDKYVDEELYRSHLHLMKQKYGLYWAKNWPEVTDPVKFVYEELSIAAYLVSLFEIEQKETGRADKVRFVDVGCGNGFLTYLLLSEGYSGSGIDLQKRGIWDIYPDNVTACLKHEKIDPTTFQCKDVDWIIGNHSDELTPWIPAIAARSLNGDHDASRATPRFFILPCCFFDFDERKYAAGFMRRTLAVKNKGQGRYELYLQYIERVVAEFGYSCDRENIRIPSTKYVLWCLLHIRRRYSAYECLALTSKFLIHRSILYRYVGLLGLRVEDNERVSPHAIEKSIALLLEDAQRSHAKT